MKHPESALNKISAKSAAKSGTDENGSTNAMTTTATIATSNASNNLRTSMSETISTARFRLAAISLTLYGRKPKLLICVNSAEYDRSSNNVP